VVEAIHCDLCGLETKHPLTKEIDGRVLHFCCAGCWQVYELQRQESTASAEGRTVSPPKITVDLASPLPEGFQEGTATQTITLPITGMTCASCVSHVGRALRAVPGVKDAVVELESGTALVTFAPNLASVSGMRDAVRKAGYDSPDPRAGQQKP